MHFTISVVIKWDVALLKFNAKHRLWIDRRDIVRDSGRDFMLVSGEVVTYIDSKWPHAISLILKDCPNAYTEAAILGEVR